MIILHEPGQLGKKSRCSISDRNETFFFTITSDKHHDPHSLLPTGVMKALSKRATEWRVNLTIHLHLAQRVSHNSRHFAFTSWYVFMQRCLKNMNHFTNGLRILQFRKRNKIKLHSCKYFHKILYVTYLCQREPG